MSTLETETLIDNAYLNHFSKHLDHVRAHLAGTDKSGRLPPSFLPPSAHWTSAEKDLFFHALAIHSRLRPDLIAKEVRTKTIVDICLYILSLESGARVNGPMPRMDLQIAMQVSDAFVALEDQKAQPLLVSEPQWEHRALEEERALELEAREKAVRARKGEAQSETNEEYRQDVRRRKKEFKQWAADRRAEWKLEDTLRTLNFTTLKAMDRVLRDEDEVRLQANEAEALDDAMAGRDSEVVESHEEAHQELAPAADSQQLVFPIIEQQAPSTSEQPIISAAFDDEMIDPMLRDQSQGAHPIPTSTAVATSGDALGHPDSATTPAHTLPYAQFRPRTPPFTPASLPTEDTPSTSRGSLVAFDPSAESHLTAAARRKLQKRLHMRKKRAEARGLSAVSTAVRLKAGRKRAEKVLRGPTAYAKPASSDQNSVRHPPSSGSPQERGRHPHLSGATLPYKLLMKLRDIGLDADALQKEYVGVMNLKGLPRLMRLYNRLHDVDVKVSSQISSEVIKLLNAHALHFTTEVMHRVIDLREQERESKRHTKGWRMGKFDRVSHVHVEKALSMMGCRSFTKKEHFDGLLERLGLVKYDFSDVAPETAQGGRSSSEDEADDERDADEAAHDGSDAEDEDGFDPLTFPLHRATLPPVVHFPAAEASSSASGVPRSLNVALYMPWPASSALTEPPAEEDLMSEDTDTDALVEDLLDEEQLDEHDRRLEEAYEESLWREFGGDPPLVAQSHSRKKRKRPADDDGADGSDT